MPRIQNYGGTYNIRQYISPEENIRPANMGPDSAASAGRAIAGEYNQAGAAVGDLGRRIASAVHDIGDVIVKYRSHREISHGALALASKQAELTEEWNQIAKTSDPNDPSIAEKFRTERVEPELEKLRGNFSTERGIHWIDSRVSHLRDHFYQKTAADQSAMAGDAVASNMHRTINALSNSVKGDPSSLAAAMATYEDSLAAVTETSPTLTPAQASKVRSDLRAHGMEKIVKAAVFGAVERNPEAGVKLASDPRFAPYISGADVKQIEAYARTQQRLAQAEARQSLLWEKQIAQEASDNTTSDMLLRLNRGEPISREEINKALERGLQAPGGEGGLTLRGYEHMLAAYDRKNKEEKPAEIAAENTRRLFERLRAPADDPERISTLDPIFKAYTKGDIRYEDMRRLQQAYVEFRSPEGEKLQRQTEQFLKGFKPQIDKSILGATLDAAGAQRFYEFEVMVERKVDEYRRAGKNPWDLFDPGKPDYIGKPETINRFVSPLDQRMRDTGKRIQGSRPPLKDIFK